MKTKPSQLCNITLLAAALALASCGDSGSSSGSAESSKPADPRVEAVFLSDAPAGAVSVLEARKAPQPGSEITVTGRVAGAVEPFSEDFATLMLVDDSVETCDRMPGDTCETPWDACCVEPKALAGARLSVQVNDESGKPIPATLKGAKGLKELDPVVVTGKVAPGSTADNLIINATGIYRKG